MLRMFWWRQTESIIYPRFEALQQGSRRLVFEVFTNFLPNLKSSFSLWFFGLITGSFRYLCYLWRLVQFHWQASLRVVHMRGYHFMSINEQTIWFKFDSNAPKESRHCLPSIHLGRLQVCFELANQAFSTSCVVGRSKSNEWDRKLRLLSITTWHAKSVFSLFSWTIACYFRGHWTELTDKPLST